MHAMLATPIITAERVRGSLDAEGFPASGSWKKTQAVQFASDWRGESTDPSRQTEVRLLFNSDTLFVHFSCRYVSLFVYPDARSDGWRDELWNRDVAEVFLQPDSRDPWVYKEFELAPNGYWIDLAVSHGQNTELHSRLRRRVQLLESEKVWIGELAVPFKSLVPAFSPKDHWRVNFFRVEGHTEPRFYSAWSPTYTEKPNFHIPDKFGTLLFRENE